MPLRAQQVGDDQPRVVAAAVGIGEAAAEFRLERGARGMPREIDRLRGREALARRQVVVDEEAEPDHPARPLSVDVRQHEAQRPHQVRRLRHQDLALEQGLAHEPEIVALEIAKPAVNELGRARRRAFREVAHLDESDGEAAAGGIAGDGGAVDAAADHQEIVGRARCGRHAARRRCIGAPVSLIA